MCENKSPKNEKNQQLEKCDKDMHGYCLLLPGILLGILIAASAVLFTVLSPCLSVQGNTVTYRNCEVHIGSIHSPMTFYIIAILCVTLLCITVFICKTILACQAFKEELNKEYEDQSMKVLDDAYRDIIQHAIVTEETTRQSKTTESPVAPSKNH